MQLSRLGLLLFTFYNQGSYFKRLRLTLETKLEVELHVILNREKRLNQVRDFFK